MTMNKLMTIAVLTATIVASQTGCEEKNQVKIAEDKPSERVSVETEKTEDKSPERVSLGPDMTEESRAQKGDFCYYRKGMGLEITQFISADAGTYVIVRGKNGTPLSVKIEDDDHEYVDGDELAPGLYRYLGVQNFVGSRIKSYEEVKSSEVERIKTAIQKMALGSILEDLVEIPGKDFRMGKTEVTQLQWKGIMGDNPARFKGGNCPVENVSWNDCQRFIQNLNGMSKNVKFRLPTEEEWEYCCRAGGKGDWGKRKNGQEGPLDVMGWFRDNSGRKTHPVAQKEPNAWGLYDMHGNVCEWTSTAAGDDRVYRGGGWNGHSVICAAGFRHRLYPDFRDDTLGFRLVSEDL